MQIRVCFLTQENSADKSRSILGEWLLISKKIISGFIKTRTSNCHAPGCLGSVPTNQNSVVDTHLENVPSVKSLAVICAVFDEYHSGVSNLTMNSAAMISHSYVPWGLPDTEGKFAGFLKPMWASEE